MSPVDSRIPSSRTRAPRVPAGAGRSSKTRCQAPWLLISPLSKLSSTVAPASRYSITKRTLSRLMRERMKPSNWKGWVPASIWAANSVRSTSCASSENASRGGKKWNGPSLGGTTARWPQAAPATTVQPGRAPPTSGSSALGLTSRLAPAQVPSGLSSSRMVTRPSPSASEAFTGFDRMTDSVSLSSPSVSPSTVTAIWPVVTNGGIVRLPAVAS